MPEGRRFFAAQAWIAGGWARDVLLVAGHDGRWAEMRAGAGQADRAGAEVLPGPVLPGVANGHSHAFQRAMAGLAELSPAGRDDFWSWRDRMYAAALRITPSQLEAIATFLYAELLQAGYTQVCEFHYLHNDLDGKPYADPLEMSLALVRAAKRAGIGLTLLPTLYMRSGFTAAGLRVDQRRFASTPDSVLRIAQALRKLGADDTSLTAGIAIHSMRAVDAGALRETAQAARGAGMPVHIHIAEQQLEVDDCIAQHGRRPIEWLLEQDLLDGGWNLVHATHASVAELHGVQRSGAAIVLCPSTEANLGDGVFDLPAWLAAGGRCCIGSDSHITRSWMEELRLLEYSGRLVLRQRNVAARAAGREATAAVLFDAAIGGGGAAADLPLAGLAAGQRADFCVLDPASPALLGIPADRVLDAAVFSSPDARVARVFVGGAEPRPPAAHAAGFAAAMHALWGGVA
ncbi:formimidoylglutamate deiminase [Ramlibacter sp. Leaf400]|uniref:formimidoylglutamate deiminase n=1 Tax=Ramlibacter sp. Leaf400 TaxID=1736365 RepID=UPI0006F593E3|nr:formimidoylglutamate deiminase [Ramlibacter sp. Leaf400]KQT09538.1 N-formylglutamate amidohydrolase [Ramlibacter sp. Leaf400]